MTPASPPSGPPGHPHDPRSAPSGGPPEPDDRIRAAFTRRRALAAGCLTALLLAALGVRVHPAPVLAAACWLAACAVPLALIDAAVRRLPDRLTVPAFLGTAAFLLLAAAVSGHWPSLLRAVLGGLALAGFYLVLLVISPSGMGLGDVKLAASLGTLLAWSGWRALVAGGFAGFLLAALYGGALLASGRATPKQHLPFGPFMIAGAFLVILVLPGPPRRPDQRM